MVGDCKISDVVFKVQFGVGQSSFWIKERLREKEDITCQTTFITRSMSDVSTSAKMDVEPAFGTLTWVVEGGYFLGEIGHFVWNLAPEKVVTWSSVEIGKYICFAFESTMLLKLGTRLSCVVQPATLDCIFARTNYIASSIICRHA